MWGGKKMFKDKPVGYYEPFVCEKGVNETTINIKEGEVFWTVKIDEEACYDTASQDSAIQISMLCELTKKILEMRTCIPALWKLTEVSDFKSSDEKKGFENCIEALENMLK